MSLRDYLQRVRLPRKYDPRTIGIILKILIFLILIFFIMSLPPFRHQIRA